MFNLISQGVSLGFSAGAMPGPFQSYLIGTTLAYGWRKTMIIIFTPLITDGPIILLMVFVLKQLPPTLIPIIQMAGGGYLLWLAYRAWKRYRSVGVNLNAEAPSQGRTLVQGLFVNWLSPGPYIFWATINGPLLLQGLNQSVWHGAGFMIAFYGTFLLLLAAYVIVFDRLRRLDARFTRAIFLVTLLVLVLFGISLIWQGLSRMQIQAA